MKANGRLYIRAAAGQFECHGASEAIADSGYPSAVDARLCAQRRQRSLGAASRSHRICHE